MEKYKDLGGDSGISAFKITDDSITVSFKNGTSYLYNYIKPGQSDVEKMKKLALSGRGLNSYINTYIRKNFFKELT